LDRKVATSDIIKGFLITDTKKVLVKSGDVKNTLPVEAYLDIYEINEKVLEKYSYFKKAFSFFAGDKKITYYLYLVTDKNYILNILKGIKVRFFILWIVVTLFIMIFLELIIERVLIKPLNYLKSFARRETNEKRKLAIEEFREIREILENTFNRLDTQIKNLYKITVTDSLTGLGNRKYLYEYLRKRISQKSKKFAVVLLDLDNFKDINDFYGHKVGDKVLIKVSETLKKFLGKNDIAVRIGGDEFSLVIESYTDEKELEKRLEKMLDTFNKTWIIDGKNIIMSVSIGVSVFPDNGSTLEELLKNADIALYEAKKQGKNIIVNFNDNLKNKINRMLELKNKFKNALENDEFELFYQAKVDRNAKVIGCEALIRWFSDEGMIPPSDFIPVAERSGFMSLLGEWISAEVLKTRKEWDAKEFLKEVSIAFNVSVEQMKNDQFVNKLKKMLEETRCNINKLEVEITESVFVENKQVAKNIINSFHEMGLEVNLDDFGTGYSSLSFLQEFKVDVIKIDKSFVDNILSEKGKIYIKTMVDMAKNLNLKTVAEGVETTEQFEVLKELGVDYFQGYLFSKPLNKKDFEEYVKSNLSEFKA
jgi:diguanylate cyclase (GGDEF)-like protein